MAKKDVIKQLTITELKKQQEKLNKVENGVVKLDGEDYKFTYDSFFKKTKQSNVIDDVVAYIDEFKDDEGAMQLSTVYSALLVIKYFTSIEVPDDVYEAMDFMKLLIDLDIFYQILEVLPSDNVAEVFDTVTDHLVLIEENIREQIEKEEKEALIDAQVEAETEVE